MSEAGQPFTAEDDQRLQDLLDRQDQGNELTQEERTEAENLVNRADEATLQKLRVGTRTDIVANRDR